MSRQLTRYGCVKVILKATLLMVSSVYATCFLLHIIPNSYNTYSAASYAWWHFPTAILVYIACAVSILLSVIWATLGFIGLIIVTHEEAKKESSLQEQ